MKTGGKGGAELQRCQEPWAYMYMHFRYEAMLSCYVQSATFSLPYTSGARPPAHQAALDASTRLVSAFSTRG